MLRVYSFIHVHKHKIKIIQLIVYEHVSKLMGYVQLPHIIKIALENQEPIHINPLTLQICLTSDLCIYIYFLGRPSIG